MIIHFYKICELLMRFVKHRLIPYYFILCYKLRAFCYNARLIRKVIKCIQLKFAMTFFMLESVLTYKRN